MSPLGAYIALSPGIRSRFHHAGSYQHVALAGGEHTYSVSSVRARHNTRMAAYCAPKPAARPTSAPNGDPIPSTSCLLPVRPRRAEESPKP